MGESNEAGDNFVAFAMSHNMRVVNTYFEKAETHKITYKSGAAESQIDYILCRSSDKGNIKDGKVILGESVTNQHIQNQNQNQKYLFGHFRPRRPLLRP